jgi:hypothetical protein
MDASDSRVLTAKWHRLNYYREQLAKPLLRDTPYYRRQRAWWESQVDKLDGDLRQYNLVNNEWVQA